MRKRRRFSNVLFTASIISTATANDECNLYIAPSTIPGAGIGLFAGSEGFDMGEYITEGGDILIPVLDIDYHWREDRIEQRSFLFDDYTWGQRMFPQPMEKEEYLRTFQPEEYSESGVVSPGIGSVANYFVTLVNVEPQDEHTTLVSSGGSINTPAAGSFSPYHNRQWRANQDIEPAQEIFVSYGLNYFTAEERRRLYQQVPMPFDYLQADALLKAFPASLQQEQQSPHSLVNEEIYQLVKSILYGWGEHRTISALPETAPTKSAIDSILDTGGTGQQFRNQTFRDLEWLQQYGQCADNIKSGSSLIPHAGQGAFARRFIRKGELVASAPLIHLPDKQVLDMYDIQSKDLTNIVHSQLLTNYCFGHPSSTLLLCPYGVLSSLINHSSKQPNARIQWSSTEHMQHPEWRNQPIETWAEEKHAGLAFDIVALRDVEADEEILIDYGLEWEQAFQKQTAKHRLGFIPGYDIALRQDFDYTLLNASHYELPLKCRIHESELLKRHYNQKNFHGYKPFPCNVIGRTNELYLVEVYFTQESKQKKTCSYEFLMVRGFMYMFRLRAYSSVCSSNARANHSDAVDRRCLRPQVMFDFPTSKLVVEDRAYYLDHHQLWSFRHPMRIPDDMLPAAWKNLLEN